MNTTRNTPCGPIMGCGCQWPGVVAFKGIRYATAGRWEYPTPVTHWEGTYQATAYGAACYQPRAFYDEEQVPEKAFYYNEFRRGEQYEYSEDCLFLNVWAPAEATPESKLPVLFYIHGGGFTGGCGNEKHFDGPVWPTKGVVAVTINYRLGPLGFACLPELSAEAGHTGNYGLYDQLCALQWVHDNIAAFGGDPGRITIMGQSAGAMSVQQLCLSPLAKGLVAGAVMSSGGGVSANFASVSPAPAHYDFWHAVMHRAQCPNLAAFRALEPAALFAAWQDEKAADGNKMRTAPVIDGQLIPRDGVLAAQRGDQCHVPYLMGSTSQDIVPPIVHKLAKDWCRLQANQGGPAAYAWFFDRQLPGDDNGAWHSSDLWYWFGTLDHCWRPMTAKDRLLSEQMVEYLTNFARTGNPNGGGLPAWAPIEKGQSKVLRLGEGETRMGGVNIAKLTHTMLTNKAPGE